MKKLINVVIAIVVIIGVGFLVYQILPEYPQNFVKSFIQPLTDSEAKLRISQVQGIRYDKLDNATYKTILEKYTSQPAWVYEKDGTTEIVTYYGRSATITIKDVEGHEDHFYIKEPIKAVFKISGNNFTMDFYVKEILFDDALKEVALEQLYSGGN